MALFFPFQALPGENEAGRNQRESPSFAGRPSSFQSSAALDWMPSISLIAMDSLPCSRMAKKAAKHEVGEPAAKVRFAHAWKTAQHSGTAWPERKPIMRKACAMTAEECKALKAKAEALGKKRSEEVGKKERGELSISEFSLRRLEKEMRLMFDDVHAWEGGEEIRQREIWFHEAQQTARAIIAARCTAPQQNLRVDDCGTGKETGDGALMLPIVYEMFRQSERCLQWAILLEATGGIDARANNLYERTPFDRIAAEALGEQWQAQIGRGWVNAMLHLTGFLARDEPFSKIPLERRKSIARLAESSSRDNIAINYDFEMEDGGGVKFEPFARMIGRQTVRMAHFCEATTQGAIDIHHLKEADGTRKPSERHIYPYSIHATCDEDAKTELIYHMKGKTYLTRKSFEAAVKRLPKDQRKPGIAEVEVRAVKDTRRRKLDDKGAEIIVLRVNWNGTRDAELGKAFAQLAAKIRPQQWPEPKEKRGNRTKDAKAALRAILNALNTNGKGLRAKDRAIALKWYRGITGDTALPWWEHVLKSK